MHARTQTASRIFSPIAGDYERWSAVLSFGQDPRWRATVVERLAIAPGERVLDVAAGTGLITRLCEQRGAEVLALDQSPSMLSEAHRRGSEAVLGTAIELPVASESIDVLTFSYLLRYVPEPAATMRELARVLRPGGRIGMVEFGRPRGFWGPWWWLYTRVGLPAAGTAIGHGWREVGTFLGGSIDDLHRRFPDDASFQALWESAGLDDVAVERRSLGGGLLMWGRRR